MVVEKRKRLTRRRFLAASTAAVVASGCQMQPSAPPTDEAAKDDPAEEPAGRVEPIIDIHQHTHYHARTDEDLVAHQRAMGITKTVLLPAGSKYGLAAQCGGNDTVLRIAKQHPDEYVFFANELPDLANAREEIEKYLRLGAIGIGEQKFPVDCDSPHIEKIATIAAEYDVPVLLHFQYGEYNMAFDRFHRILEKFPKVNFIGHAQTWWGHIDKNHDKTVMYPKTSVTAGGLTDRWLADYPNMYGDLSAGSGQNSLTRDEDHARGFLDRHQDKLLYGSDCADTVGQGKECSGAGTLELVRRLSPNPQAARKILYENAARILKI